jgi:cysteine synthase
VEYRLLIDGSDAGAAATQLGELADWLRHERELRGRVRMEHGEMAGDRMGGIPEALVVAVSTGGAVTVLARAAVEWVKHRTRDLTLKVVRPSGESLEISVQRATASDVLVTELLDFLKAQQGTDSDETP